MKANEYTILNECVEVGVAAGYARCFKHTENPSTEAMLQSICDAIMLQICEYFIFEDDADV